MESGSLAFDHCFSISIDCVGNVQQTRAGIGVNSGGWGHDPQIL